jgi:hypothetical protein
MQPSVRLTVQAQNFHDNSKYCEIFREDKHSKQYPICLVTYNVRELRVFNAGNVEITVDREATSSSTAEIPPVTNMQLPKCRKRLTKLYTQHARNLQTLQICVSYIN